MKKLLLITILLVILSTSAIAVSYAPIESRARIMFDPAGDNDELVWSTNDDDYIFKSGVINIYEINDNFTTFRVSISGGGALSNYMAWANDNTPLMSGGSPTYPSTLFTVEDATPTSIRMSEVNLYGINDINGVNSVELNGITPLPYNFAAIDGISFDNDNNLLYVLHNDTLTVNVYDVYKPDGNYDANWVRTFQLSQNCGYTDDYRIDLEIYDNQLYLLCGDKNALTERTAYSFSLLGDFRDEYHFQTLDNHYHSITFNGEEIILYDDDDKELVFFDFVSSQTGGGETGGNGEVVVAGGVSYNTSNLCISENILCSNASVSINQYGFVVLDCVEQTAKTWCSVGCENINDTNDVLQGECINGACVNECQDPEFDSCETPNTYNTCTINTLDGCLDLSSGLFCQANTICEDSEIGHQCVAVTIAETGTFTQPFINIDLDVNHTNVYETIQEEIEIVSDIVTIPLLTSFAGNPVPKQIASFFLKSFAEEVAQTVKITGVSGLEPTEYFALSCDFTENLLEQDYIETLDDFTTSSVLTTDNITSYIDIDSLSVKTLEQTSLGQEIELTVKPIGTGVNTIQFVDGAYNVLELEISYNATNNHLEIRETGFNKLLVNETGVAGNDSLDYIYLRHLFIAEANVNNIQIGVFREVNGMSTEQYYYSLPISYYTTQATSPTNIVFDNEDASTLRLYQIIQREQSGYNVYTTNSEQNCEYTALSCTNQRAWTNDRFALTYYFDEEIQTCVNEIDGIINGDIEDQPSIGGGEADLLETFFNGGEKFSQGTKFIIAVLSLMIVFGLFYYVYAETREALILVVGSLVTICTVFIFAFFGYLPVWLLVLIGIVSILLMSSQFVRGRG